MNICVQDNNSVSGEFVTLGGERYYAIREADKMAPFFISVISDSDHWLFASSTGGLTAGRVSPETALFPYVTVDNIYDNALNTGCKTLFRVTLEGVNHNWEPFNVEHDGRFQTTRNLYKNLLGNKLCFEEINHDLKLAFRYTWATSDDYGFARQCEISNLADTHLTLELVDGFQNLLPAGAPRFAQTNSSNLVDAYKWTELDADTGLARYTMFSALTDRAEPCESLRANTVFALGLDNPKVLLSNQQLKAFRGGKALTQEVHKRGIRGAYLVNASVDLAAGESQKWQLIADLELDQSKVVALRNELKDKAAVAAAIQSSIEKGADELARIMAAADGFQSTAEENVSVHHYANVLFNVLRGGIFDEQYLISGLDFVNTIKMFNSKVYQRNQALLDGLPEKIAIGDLLDRLETKADVQLTRLGFEYLPITFGRRHGDPSRPWNQFAIKLKDEEGDRLLSYQGNWRDIFQNWEALTFSYPEFVESVIAKFVNASTIDGYNPYRITKEGIDWEVEEPDDPWSFIGYWGDHQIIYLLKLLELSDKFHPSKLAELLHKPVFSYANVPYRIKGFDDIIKNAKDTVVFDEELAVTIDKRVAQMGADGKLVMNAEGEVYQVNLLEKLLVPLLSKLSNLVIDGGIWMNTQRPEWNDANNALVGQGISMVTLYYIRRYINFMKAMLANNSGNTTMSAEVATWLAETATALNDIKPNLGNGKVSTKYRFAALKELGQSATRYRQAVYSQGGFSGSVAQPVAQILSLLEDALVAVDHTITTNQRDDGLYHAYNLIDLKADNAEVQYLYMMLEGQVAALSAGAIEPEDAADMLEKLYHSSIYREDQKTFILYPDRDLPSFLEKNKVAASAVAGIGLIEIMQGKGDSRLMSKDAEGFYRFNADMTNAGALNAQLDSLGADYGDAVNAAREALLALYEETFNHQEFTGRSGGMFCFEGLGCVYWHMVSKLLLAANENFFAALEKGSSAETCKRLGELYYRIREGIGFNKTPGEYGAFPCDPYSHTPGHAGAQQPGMTGQVKEEILTRFTELGVMIANGEVSFNPALLRACEFVAEPQAFRFLDVEDNWQALTVPANGLAFTWCQVPVVYQLNDDAAPAVTLQMKDGSRVKMSELTLSADICRKLFKRTGEVRQMTLTLNSMQLFC